MLLFFGNISWALSQFFLSTSFTSAMQYCNLFYFLDDMSGYSLCDL